MLMYGFQLRYSIAVGLAKEIFQSVKEFLEGMQEMLQAVRDSICSTQDRTKTYADKGIRDFLFKEGDLVYLQS